MRKNYNNAFVDFFVGLDFLLAPDTEKSKKLKQRISLLVFKPMHLSFIEQLDRLDFLYDVRSAYVHQGKNVTVPDLIELRNIARAVLAVLLELSISSQKSRKLKLSEWLNKVDELVQVFYEGLSPKMHQLSEIGIKSYKGLNLQNSLDKWDFD